MADYTGFVVLVTGASTGLGRAIAVETARLGAETVIINYARSVDEAQETARLVEAHGGTIEVRSEVGRGTTFVVALPKAPSAVEGPA